MVQIAKYQGSRSHDALKEYVLTQLEAAPEKDQAEDAKTEGKRGDEPEGEVKVRTI